MATDEKLTLMNDPKLSIYIIHNRCAFMCIATKIDVVLSAGHTNWWRLVDAPGSGKSPSS